ncbi:hypothetical protein VWW30_004313 [Cronobacter sakazakii]|nr:hypothetical protein [Cronobacter sakazakii]
MAEKLKSSELPHPDIQSRPFALFGSSFNTSALSTIEIEAGIASLKNLAENIFPAFINSFPLFAQA